MKLPDLLPDPLKSSWVTTITRGVSKTSRLSSTGLESLERAGIIMGTDTASDSSRGQFGGRKKSIYRGSHQSSDFSNDKDTAWTRETVGQ